MKCERCGKEHDGSFATGRFCSRSCANSRKDDVHETKLSNCIQCGKEIEVNKRTSSEFIFCKECRIIRKLQKIKCPYCGNSKDICKKKRPDVCKKFKLFPSLIKYFGFDESVIGTERVYEEFDRITNLVYEEYVINGLSLKDLMKKYNHKDQRHLSGILKNLKVKIRDQSQAISLSILKKGISKKQRDPKYKSGWHTTWNNKKVFYRSSYELKFCKKLDNQKIDYEMENLRILYFDSQQFKQRIAIPDFYIRKENKIIEIKNKYGYDEQNMDDKIKSYLNHGYNIELYVDNLNKPLLKRGHSLIGKTLPLQGKVSGS